MTVLVLSEDCDPTVDLVVEEMQRRDVPVFRADTAWFPQRMTLGAELRDGRWCGSLRTEHRTAELVGLRSAWYRRPTTFVLPESLSGPERRHAMWEAKLGVGGLLADLPVLWVNHPSADADAAYKPAQLATAARCGLTVPPTTITNRPEDVRRFAAEQGPVVVKTLAFGTVFEGGAAKAIYTHVLSPDDLADLAGVGTTMHLLQRFIGDKALEARVTVVGQRMFAAGVHAGSDAAHIDWRSDSPSLTYTVIDVPEQVAAGMRAFMAAFRLQFGAFDFVVDTSAAWWFLEANSGGQYGFIETATGLPITTAMADLLENGQS